jgi:hypothetical protein
MAALLARLRRQRPEVAGNEDFGVAMAASDHLQWSSVTHDYKKVASIIPDTKSVSRRLKPLLQCGKITLPMRIFTTRVQSESSRRSAPKPASAASDEKIRFRSPFAYEFYTI